MIEPFIRHEPLLTREQVNHLTIVEETMLESMVWEEGSVVYKEVEGREIPTWSDVAPPNAPDIMRTPRYARGFFFTAVGNDLSGN